MKKEKKNLLGKWRQVLKSKIKRKGKGDKLEKGGLKGGKEKRRRREDT